MLEIEILYWKVVEAPLQKKNNNFFEYAPHPLGSN